MEDMTSRVRAASSDVTAPYDSESVGRWEMLRQSIKKVGVLRRWLTVTVLAATGFGVIILTEPAPRVSTLSDYVRLSVKGKCPLSRLPC